MLYGISSGQGYCLYLRDSVSGRMNIFYIFPINILSLVPKP